VKGKKRKKELKTLWSRIRYFVRDWMHVLAGTLFALSLIMTVLGVIGIMTPYRDLDPPLKDIIKPLQEPERYDICMGLGGSFLLLVSAYYFFVNLYRRWKFNRLFDIDSKAKFLGNLNELEELAWNLSTKHEMMVEEKKREFKIR